MKYQIGFKFLNIWFTKYHIDLSWLPICHRIQYVEDENKFYIIHPMFERFIID